MATNPLFDYVPVEGPLSDTEFSEMRDNDQVAVPFVQSQFSPESLEPVRMDTSGQEDAIREWASQRIAAARDNVGTAMGMADAASQRMLANAIGMGGMQAFTGVNMPDAHQAHVQQAGAAVNRAGQTAMQARQTEGEAEGQAALDISQLQAEANLHNQQAQREASMRRDQIDNQNRERRAGAQGQAMQMQSQQEIARREAEAERRSQQQEEGDALLPAVQHRIQMLNENEDETRTLSRLLDQATNGDNPEDVRREAIDELSARGLYDPQLVDLDESAFAPARDRLDWLESARETAHHRMTNDLKNLSPRQYEYIIDQHERLPRGHIDPTSERPSHQNAGPGGRSRRDPASTGRDDLGDFSIEAEGPPVSASQVAEGLAEKRQSNENRARQRAEDPPTPEETEPDAQNESATQRRVQSYNNHYNRIYSGSRGQHTPRHEGVEEETHENLFMRRSRQ